MLRLLLIVLLMLTPALAADREADAAFAQRFAPLTGTRPAQWRVVWTTRPASEATVSWTTAEPGRTHRVLYDATSPGATAAAPSLAQKTHRDGPYTRTDADTTATAYFHHARLTGLTPSTTYRFVLESDGIRSRELHFTTAPDDDRPFALLVGGDSRTGWRARCFVNESIAAIAARDASVLALSHGGDFVKWGDRWDEWSRWLTHHELTTTASGRVLPILPTRGNHDYGAPFDEVFDAPGSAWRNYYRTHLSADVSLLTLNSNIPVAGDQLDWLEAKLAAANADSRWVLVNYHRALYPAVKTPGEAKSFWTPLFDRYGVDVALESDGHAIKRTMPIRADALDDAGVVYIGEGGLGVPQRTPRTEPWYLQPPAVATNGHHVLRLDFSAAELRMRILRLPRLPAEIDPADYHVLIPPHASWSYLAGADAPPDWGTPSFDDTSWPAGFAGIGFGDDDDRTVLDDMRGNYTRVYLRSTFDGEALAETETLTLMCRYDDAFIAYLNGAEVARAGIEPPAAPGKKPKIRAHEALRIEAFPLVGWRQYAHPGTNVLSIVGANRMRSDRDFTLDPWLVGDPVESAPEQDLVLEVVDDYRLAARRP